MELKRKRHSDPSESQSYNRLLLSSVRFRDLVITFEKLTENFEVLTECTVNLLKLFSTNFPSYAGSIFQDWFDYLIAIIDEHHLLNAGVVCRSYQSQRFWRVMDFDDTEEREYMGCLICRKSTRLSTKSMHFS